MQRYFGKLGACDGGETFLDKLGGSNGFPVTQRKDDFAEVRTAREGESIVVGTLNLHERHVIGDRVHSPVEFASM